MTPSHRRSTVYLIWCIVIPTLFVTFMVGSAGWLRLAPALILLGAGIAATLILGASQPDAAPSTTPIQPVGGERWTRRELEVLALIAEGCTNDEIADGLVIALSTVKTHVNNIYRKLGVRNRVQAVACARAQGLVV